ncbi:MAG: hypothetical protein ONB13_00670 [candidate division KSB1 bacterium]|nr:hypothetical protein [candidate division KSB1 bacterium]MDZ7334542.1 hypothetical protein [candidate division KSB1 bacterium]MDZ7358699.1 hypothetical protein [candidate division KSB1 bacterium]MDZ7375104.1 hypothetical protein [candidate division KSB1 bacterium]MDZ7400845.1 hypothetical protein [candidate division KSB1 bacterium]
MLHHQPSGHACIGQRIFVDRKNIVLIHPSRKLQIDLAKREQGDHSGSRFALNPYLGIVIFALKRGTP